MKQTKLPLTRNPSEGMTETTRDAPKVPFQAPLQLPRSLIDGPVTKQNEDEHLVDKGESPSDLEALPLTHTMTPSGVARLPASLAAAAAAASDDASLGSQDPPPEPEDLLPPTYKKHPSLSRQTTGGSLQPLSSPLAAPSGKLSADDRWKATSSDSSAISTFSPKRPPMSGTVAEGFMTHSPAKTSDRRRNQTSRFTNDVEMTSNPNVSTALCRPRESPFYYHQQEDDNESLNSNSDGIIAVGVPARPVTPDDSTTREEQLEERLRSQPVDMLEDANQAAVSNVIARNFAEMEFNKAEKGSKEEDDEAMIIDVVRRRSSRMSLTRRSQLAMAILGEHSSGGEQGFSSSTTTGTSGVATSPNKSSSRSPTYDFANFSDTDHAVPEGFSPAFGLKQTAGLIEESGCESVSDIDADDVSGDGSDDLEAGTGIPVVLPGAFAMIGMDATPGRQLSGYDSGADDGENPSEQPNDERQQGSSDSPPEADEGEDETIAVEESELAPSSMRRGISAVLARDQMVVDGQIVTADDNSETTNARQKRWRWRQGFIVFFLVVAAAATATIIVVVMNQGNGGDSPTQEPSLEGWELVGKVLRSSADDDQTKFGTDLALSMDGNRLVVGEPGVDGGPSELAVGRVNIYDWNNVEKVWHEIHFLVGHGEEAESGHSLSINGNGTRVAVGEPKARDVLGIERGQIRIHEEDAVTGDWKIIGTVPLALDDTTTLDRGSELGHDVAMSADGSTFVCSAPRAPLSASIQAVGLVQVYEQRGARWSQKGDDIMGTERDDLFGWSVAVSADGDIIAIGGIGKDDNTGFVHVFAWKGQAWKLIGQELAGAEAQDHFGISVDLSADGSILAVGANKRDEVGVVSIWQLTEDDIWQPLGESIRGTDPTGKLGSAVALDRSGLIVAVGSPDYSSGGDELKENGMVQVFDYDNTTDAWAQREGNIEGEFKRDRFGAAVTLSADGRRVAAGAPQANFDGRLNEVGRVEVYDSVTTEVETA